MNEVVNSKQSHIIFNDIKTKASNTNINTNSVNKDFDIDNLEFKKKYIIDTIKNFSKVEHIEIFKIFKKYNVKYTENSNGIFVNLNILNETIINKIETFVNFCIANKDYLNAEKSKIEKMKNLISEKNNLQKENLNFDHNNISETSANESNYQYQYEDDNVDNNEMYYQESKFIIPFRITS